MAGLSCNTWQGVIENTWSEIASNVVLTINNSANCSFNGVLRGTCSGSGTLALVKTGTGTQTLVGGNIVYSGGTTVNGGTLQFGDGVNVTVPPGNVTVNGASSTVAFCAAYGATTTYSQVVSGTGNVNKTGSGNLYLSGANTYTGATNLVASSSDGTQGVVLLGCTTAPAVQGNVNFVGGYWLMAMAANQFGSNSGMNFASPGEFILNGYNQTVASLNDSTGGYTVLENAHQYSPTYWGIAYPTTSGPR